MVEKNEIRSFLAFKIPDNVTNELASIVEQMKSKTKGIKWVDPANYHCTIKFFGNIEENFLNDKLSNAIEEILLGKSKVKLECKGIGVFPNWRYPSVVWAGLVGDTFELMNWHKEFEDSFEKLGIGRDQRMFRMHLTIGRAKAINNTTPLMKFVEKLVDKSFGSINIDKLMLYKSQLTKKGSIYTVIREFGLPR